MTRIASAATIGFTGCTIPVVDGDEFDIGMSANAFRPDVFTTPVGETVTWKNDGSRGHTVTAYDEAMPEGAAYVASGGFDDEASARQAWEHDKGGIIEPGAVFQLTFEVPGRYTYFCVPHEDGGMIGELVIDG